MKKYPFYTVYNKKYIIAGWDFKSDSQDFIADEIECNPALKGSLRTFKPSYLERIGLNPSNPDNLRNLCEIEPEFIKVLKNGGAVILDEI